jgi:predicted lipoprotein with Yx(FWY)xxD motif
MRTFPHATARGLAVGLLAAAVFAAAGCNNTDDSTRMPADDANAQVDARATNVPSDSMTPADAATDGTTAASLTVATLEGVDGPYIADGAGNAMYFLEGDTDGSKCVDDCKVAWMPVLVTGATPSGAPGLDASKVSTITRADGGTQVSYNGHPLYRYTADNGAGSIAGHGVEDKWGHWYLLTPAGEEHEGVSAEADAGLEPAPSGQDDTNP